MPINYTALTADRDTAGSIKRWVNNNAIDAATILEESEAWIYQRLRVRDNRTSTTGTMTASQIEVTYPTGWRNTYRFGLTGTISGKLTKKDLDFVLGARSYDTAGAITTSIPSYYADDGTSMIFDVRAAQALVYRWDYHYALNALSTATETNFLTAKYPSLLRSVCMYKAYEWLKNTQMQTYWMAEAQRELTAVNIADDMENEDIEMDVMISDGY